jgi:isocitrate/isopropylmalate dehydrogenase
MLISCRILLRRLAGSIGIAPTSNLEPNHGSAFDITGKGLANPVGTFWTAVEMLAWLGEEEASKFLMECGENVCDKVVITADLGGTVKTVDVTNAVCEEIKTQAAVKKIA